MAETSIEWTDKTWNPVRGCSRVSLGCGGAAGGGGCYAERQAARFSGPGMPYEGLVRIGKQGPRWTGVVRLVPDMLDAPLHWRKPRRVFVNSMSDLFHEALSNEQIAAVFGVMAACPQHTFQVLTKRAKRMREWFAWVRDDDTADGTIGPGLAQRCGIEAVNEGADLDAWGLPDTWPLSNVHLGVSCEDQATWDARTAELRRCPAAVRWVSLEPQIGDVGVEPALTCGTCGFNGSDFAQGRRHREDCAGLPPIDWIVQGGESGAGARGFQWAWARAVRDQCRAAGTACFFKQAGPAPFDKGDAAPHSRLRDRKGGDWNEWPESLRVRMFPGDTWGIDAERAIADMEGWR